MRDVVGDGGSFGGLGSSTPGAETNIWGGAGCWRGTPRCAEGSRRRRRGNRRGAKHGRGRLIDRIGRRIDRIVDVDRSHFRDGPRYDFRYLVNDGVAYEDTKSAQLMSLAAKSIPGAVSRSCWRIGVPLCALPPSETLPGDAVSRALLGVPGWSLCVQWSRSGDVASAKAAISCNAG